MRYSRLPIALALLGCSAAATAHQFPTPEDPRARALLERTQMDTAKLQALLAFSKPAQQAWPCEAPLPYLYQPAGIVTALPEDQLPEDIKTLLAQQKRTMRQATRGNGMDPNSAPVFTHGKIELIPIKAQCTDGKLDGPVEYYLSFETVTESNVEQFSPLSNKVEKTRNAVTDTAQTLISMSFKDGKPQPSAGSRTLRRGSVLSRTTFENPAVQKSYEESMAKTGMLTRPMAMSSVVLGGADGVVTFSLNDKPEVTGGLFGVNTTWSKQLSTMVMLLDGQRQTTYMYTEAQPLSIMRMNKETGTTESVTYMDNYLKKMGKKPGDMVGTDNLREIVLNGRDMLEMHTCMIDFKPVKIDPCPIE